MVIESIEISAAANANPDTVHIRVNPSPGHDVPSSLRLWSQSCSSGRWVEPNLLTMSTDDFRSTLRGFLLLHQREGAFSIKYDSVIEGHLSSYLSESQALEDAKKSFESGTSPRVSTLDLKSSGFLRHSSLSSDQVRDISRLADLRHGANFSVPGAGKTNALLATHCLERIKNPSLKLLVVCPKNAFISWDDELELCVAGEEKFVRLQGGRNQIRDLLEFPPNFSMMSYQQLRISQPLIREFLSSSKIHLVLDESHRIKGGRSSQQGKTAIDLAPLAFRRDILSGTPMPQGIPDIVAQLEFLWPGQGLGQQILEPPGPVDQLAIAKEVLAPLHVRTTKKELGLQDPIIRYTSVPMTESETETHQLLKSEARALLMGLDLSDRAHFKAIGKQVVRLLQYSSHPSLILKSLKPSMRGGELEAQLSQLVQKPTSKLISVRKSVNKIMQTPGEKVVIWTTFVDVIEMLEAEFQNFGSISIHGGIETGTDGDGERERRIRAFNDNEDVRILVANPAACGEGISLHKAAHNAIYFDRNFNAAHYLQSVDRIHRRGLPEGVETKVEILVQSGTIEEAVRDRLSAKVAALMELMDDPGLNTLVFDPEDVGDDGIEVGFMDSNDIAALGGFLLDDG